MVSWDFCTLASPPWVVPVAFLFLAALLSSVWMLASWESDHQPFLCSAERIRLVSLPWPVLRSARCITSLPLWSVPLFCVVSSSSFAKCSGRWSCTAQESAFRWYCDLHAALA